jgi:hypothetical protein
MSNQDQNASGMRQGNMTQSYEGDDMARHNNNKRKGVSISSQEGRIWLKSWKSQVLTS